MSKVNNDSRSISPASCNGFATIPEEVIKNGAKEASFIKGNKTKRIRFYHNGNRLFKGIIIPISVQRYRTFDALKTELTNIFIKRVTMPTGVQNIYSMDGVMVSDIGEFENGKDYICTGKGETFKKIEYGKPLTINTRRASNPEISLRYGTSTTRKSADDYIKPRFITLVRNGAKPRKVFRVFLNKRNATNMDQFLKVLTDVAQLDTGAVRKVFNESGERITCLMQVFANYSSDIFFVYGSERHSQNDFVLTAEEKAAAQSFRKRTITTY